MKKLLTLIFIFTGMVVFAQQSKSRVITNFDANWKFALGDFPQASNSAFDDAAWRSLSVPHDWSIELENDRDAPGGGNIGFFPTGIGWYRKTFDVAKFNPDKKYSIEFDGVHMNSELWLNGEYLGKRPYGYSSFSYDLSGLLKSKGNVLAVRVDNSEQPNSRWYTGSGIYRHVRLVETNPLHFEKWSVFYYTKSIENESAILHVEASVVNENQHAVQEVAIRHALLDTEGNEVAFVTTSIPVNAKSTMKAEQEMKVAAPLLWSVESPNLYTLQSVILVDGKESDCVFNTLGIRTIEYHVDKGFLLNGKQVKMKGVNLHHDGGPVGAAVPERVWERRLEILKEGGCNAIRTAHNPMAPEFYELCNQLGFLVMDEAFDEWIHGKRDFSYQRYFKEWHLEDLKAMVYRDRNHPSVVMWSIGNEVPDQSSKEGPELARKMIDLCKAADPTRLVTAGNDRIAADDSPASEAYLAEFENEIVGYNYPDRWHERRELYYHHDKQQHPGRRVVATESTGMGGVRGAYFLGRNPEKIQAAYAQGRPIDVEQRWKFTMLYDYVIGDFMWTGIDYYGESWRWPSRGASSGYLDNCGFKKDGYYFFKSIWTEDPTLHLLPHWNLEGREGQIVPVICYTNCDSVELFLNGKSYGEKFLEFPRKGNNEQWNQPEDGKVHTSTGDLHLSWDVPYEPGELVAKGKKDGKEYTCRLVTAGEPAQIRLSSDREVIKADPTDVAHLTVEILDKDGNMVPTAGNLVRFEVEGATIIGVESGNMSDLSSPKAKERKAFNGLCLAIIQSEKPGTISVKAVSDGLKSAVINIEAK
ncbi:glycoside hydrolase family 2 TIM barrel-domain containing protein [Roseimarinus sediminis]|uniref:glycoside hydrolase family 2 TIM barrel-domain containing protein n=1 Tax=Roseimarinus sediminis TaxID=1610899 RepID=UPI003D1E5733